MQLVGPVLGMLLLATRHVSLGRWVTTITPTSAPTSVSRRG